MQTITLESTIAEPLSEWKDCHVPASTFPFVTRVPWKKNLTESDPEAAMYIDGFRHDEIGPPFENCPYVDVPVGPLVHLKFPERSNHQLHGEFSLPLAARAQSPEGSSMIVAALVRGRVTTRTARITPRGFDIRIQWEFHSLDWEELPSEAEIADLYLWEVPVGPRAGSSFMLRMPGGSHGVAGDSVLGLPVPGEALGEAAGAP